MALISVTDAEFKSKVLESKKPVLVDFWAEWCGPCKAIAPLLEELSQEYADKVDIVKLNIDENAETTTQFKIKGIPTLLLFKEGNVVDQIVGSVPKDNLKSLIDKAL